MCPELKVFLRRRDCFQEVYRALFSSRLSRCALCTKGGRELSLRPWPDDDLSAKEQTCKALQDSIERERRVAAENIVIAAGEKEGAI